jgi:menaquinone reductase, multiheme cytochrome c subunit
MLRNTLIFAFGLACALVAGWVLFPHELYVQRQQPLEFHHQMHAAKSGSADCGQCHVLRDDGAYVGLPSLETCAGCHSTQMGSSPAEATLVNNYIKTGQPVPWLVYSQQPANVWFSHAIHVKRAGLACTQCHGNQGETDQMPVYQQNRISGYSRDIWGHSMSRLRRAAGDGMKMTDCENCHQRHHVEVSCLGCHK